jgi:radical SAM/Cys-rich protein
MIDKIKDLKHAQSQLEILGECRGHTTFEDKLKEHRLYPLKPTGVEIMQINLGKMCNQTCKHCHVDAGPTRQEIMSRETMEACLTALDSTGIHTVDLTGGAPEMNPHFRWFVEELSFRKLHIIVRCNLTIIVANPKYHDLPNFYKENSVEVVSSLPYFAATRTDAQRGAGVFDRSIRALTMLNEAAYGMPDSSFILNLVYNPSGAFLPADQRALEAEFKRRLRDSYNIEFNNLYTITNLPISRFLEYLVQSGNYETYMAKLVDAYNPAAALGVMCRNTLSVGWDGFLYDCDFNQMLELKLSCKSSEHIGMFDLAKINARDIVFNNHCFGCTSGSGSSCGGATV